MDDATRNELRRLAATYSALSAGQLTSAVGDEAWDAYWHRVDELLAANKITEASAGPEFVVCDASAAPETWTESYRDFVHGYRIENDVEYRELTGKQERAWRRFKRTLRLFRGLGFRE